MKKVVLMLYLIMFTAVTVFSQKNDKDTSYWDVGSVSSVTVAQSSFQNWVAGGENSLAINAFSNLHFNFKKDKHSWTNSINLAYGLIKQQDRPFRKTDDKIELNSQYGFKAFDNFYYTMLFNFRTQFAPGYDYGAPDTPMTSKFMAPGYAIFSVGMDYKPKKWLGIYFSPVSGKMTFVLDTALSNQGAYGVEPGKQLRYELGAYAKIFFNKEVLKNVTVNMKTTLFSNYLHNPQNIDVNFEGLLMYKITNFLTFNFRTQAIYDDDIKILDPETGRKGPRLQLMEVFGLGITVKFPE